MSLHVSQLTVGLPVVVDEFFRGDAPDWMFGVVYVVTKPKTNPNGDIEIIPIEGGRRLRINPLALDLAEIVDTR